MKTLTVWQPWASLLITPDPRNAGAPIKDAENRKWWTDFRGMLGIHAGKKYDSFGAEWIRNMAKDYLYPDQRDVVLAVLDEAESLPLGCFIGSVLLVGCTKHHTSWWSDPEQYKWIARNPKSCSPIPYPGKRGLWNFPDELLPAELRRG